MEAHEGVTRTMQHHSCTGKNEVLIRTLIEACSKQDLGAMLRLLREDIIIQTDLRGPEPDVLIGIGQCLCFLDQLFQRCDRRFVARVEQGTLPPTALLYHPGQEQPYAILQIKESRGRISELHLFHYKANQ